MIFITDAEKLQLEEFLIDRQWKPGTSQDTWIQFRWKGSEELDLPYFFLATERRGDDVFEVGGMGVGDNTWSDEEVQTHLTDILKAGTDYGARLNVERYLAKLGVEGAQGHAINVLRAVYGDLEVPAPPAPLKRTLFYDAKDGYGWVQFTWKGGESIHVVTSVRSVDADGYSTYSGYLRSCAGNAIPFPNGIFGGRAYNALTGQNNVPLTGYGVREVSRGSLGEGHNVEPIPHADLPRLPEEVLLEVRGESRGGPTSNEPGSGERDS
jgi:hypothetical protein